MSNDKMTLKTEKRTQSGKGAARKLRARGRIPAVVYGPDIETTSLTVDPDELYDMLTTRRGQNIVFELQIDEGDDYEYVMVRDYQLEPVRRELIHADFIKIDPQEKVRVRVPVEPTGRPEGVKEGGRLQMVRGEVDVTCLPDDIPEVFEHAVEHLNMGDAVLASEIELPDGVEPAYKVDYAVCRVAIPRGTEQARQAAIALGADIELEEEGPEVPGEELPEGEEAEIPEEGAEEEVPEEITEP